MTFHHQQQKWPGLEGRMDPRPDYGAASYRGSRRLAGRRALITGGDSGIGRAVALAFAREGADVAIGYLPEEQPDAEETVRVVEAAGRRCLALPGDIQDQAFCRQMVATTAAEFGGLEILINNAAYQMSHRSMLDIPAAEIERVFRTNIYAMFYLCQEAIPLMKRGASIINTASVQAYQPSHSILHYAASKAAIVGFTKGLAQELAPKGIRVNAVAPGPIWTPLIVSTMDDGAVENFGADAPLGRAGQPAEMAPIYVLLASGESSYVTGMVYGATGGEITA
ncbi:MAG TPA: SDR family oxidoreductase [Burkholderiales bacterium]|nr:SDR family oxidoreductase [Burkholderiales bacterium]